MAADELVEQVAEILQQAAETHHTVYAISDGTDADWASWYSEWLVSLSELPELLGEVVPSELTYMLVRLDREHASDDQGMAWQPYYAQRLAEHFGQ